MAEESWKKEFPTERAAGDADRTRADGIGAMTRIFLPDTDAGATEHALVDPSSSEMPPFAVRPVRVHLLGEIARGGMGVVLKGRDPDLGRDIAVKLLLESHKENADLVRRFVEEAQIAGQLQHPGIVPLYELGVFGDGRPYFTMKLVKGRTLAELLAERDGPEDDLPRFLGIFEQICQTMAYAHARDVIHRDLKPSNVMVGSFGEVQVMDWGLAKVLPKGGVVDDAAAGKVPAHGTVIATARVISDSDLSQAGSVMGTPAYMAPEQARGEGETVDRRADVFALGSILCEILTGEPAFVGRKAGEIHRKAALGDLAEAVVRLDACGADGELIALARDCLAREAEDRPPHAAAVTDGITCYLTGVQDKLRAAEIGRATEQTRAEEEVKRRALADELAREAEARALEAQRTAVAAEGRAKAERQSRRMTAALAASVLGLAVVSGGGYAWFLSQRAERQARVDLALREAEVLRDQAAQAGDDLSRWNLAREASRAVERLLSDARDDTTRQRVASLVKDVSTAAGAAEADRKLVESLLDIRSAEADDLDSATTDANYTAAFRAAGLDVSALSPEQAGARIRARPASIAVALAAALDHWASVRREYAEDRPGALRLTSIARAADPDPWRNGLRTALEIVDQKQRTEALRVVAAAAKIDELASVNLALLGSALLDVGDSQNAESVLRRAQRRNPGDMWLNYDLALCLERLGRREEAIRYYTAARSIQPVTAHSLAHALETRREDVEATAVFRDLKRLQPKNGRHAICLARILAASGQKEEAARVVESTVAMLKEESLRRPDDQPIHFDLGRALEMQGKHELAIAQYQIARQMRPGHIKTYENHALILIDQGRLEEAITLCREALTIKRDADIHNTLATALKRQTKVDEAIVEYRAAIRLRPEIHNYHEYLAVALRERGRFDEAIAEFRIALRIDPLCSYSHRILGDIFSDRGEPERAIAEYNEMIKIKPDDGEPHDLIGFVLERHGKTEEAIEQYRTAARLSPTSSRYHNSLAWALVFPRDRSPADYNDALAHARKAVELEPADGYIVNTLALAEYRVGHWNESIAAAERSMALREGGSASDWFFLAMAHRQKGAQDEARKWFEKAVSWTKEKQPRNEELLQFWGESARLLGLPGPHRENKTPPSVPVEQKKG